MISREAEALRDAALMELYTVAPIPSVLDRLVWHFGEERLAEVTGRSKRSIRLACGSLKVVPRSAQANSAEAAAFMAGTKDVLLFTDAGGTGRSYHAAATAGTASAGAATTSSSPAGARPRRSRASGARTARRRRRRRGSAS